MQPVSGTRRDRARQIATGRSRGSSAIRCVLPCSVNPPPSSRSSHFDGSVVGQAELPQRHLVGAFLAVLRIEVDEDEDAIVLLAASAAHRTRIWSFEALRKIVLRKSQSAGFSRRMRLSLRMCSLMLPGRSKSQALSSYFSEFEIFLLAGHRRALADLEAVVQALDARQRRGERAAHDEARPAAGLEVVRVDVRRVGEEVRPVILAPSRPCSSVTYAMSSCFVLRQVK